MAPPVRHVIQYYGEICQKKQPTSKTWRFDQRQKHQGTVGFPDRLKVLWHIELCTSNGFSNLLDSHKLSYHFEHYINEYKWWLILICLGCTDAPSFLLANMRKNHWVGIFQVVQEIEHYLGVFFTQESWNCGLNLHGNPKSWYPAKVVSKQSSLRSEVFAVSTCLCLQPKCAKAARETRMKDCRLQRIRSTWPLFKKKLVFCRDLQEQHPQS